MVLGSAGALAAPADGSLGSSVPTDADSTGGASTDAATALVVLGTDNLTWADVQTVAADASAPAYQQAAQTLLDAAALNQPVNVVTRTAGAITCPADGWLTLSSGQRSQAVLPDDAGNCPSAGDWADVVATATDSGYQLTPGLLADSLAQVETEAVAVGQGAQLALTSSDGVAPQTADTLTQALADNPDLIVVDTTPTTAQLADAPNADAARILALTQALDQLPADQPYILLSLADSEQSGLQLGLLPSTASTGDPLTDPSTHQLGLLQLADLTPTILEATQSPVPANLPGQAVPLTANTGSTGTSVDTLVDDALHARASALSTPVVAVLLVGALVLLVGFTLLRLRLRQNTPTRTASASALRSVWLASVFVLALMPLATAVNLAPWWRVGAVADRPSLLAVLAVSGAIVGLALLLTALAARLYGRPAARWLPVGLAALTSLLLVDGATGARLAFNGPLGMNAVVAGRFFGVNNTAFAQAAAALVVAVGLGCALYLGASPEAGRRRRSVALAALVLLVALVLDGAGPLGADVGGALTLIPTAVILLAGVARIRLGWRRLFGVALATVAIVGVLGLWDYSRPAAQRTHLGRFVGEVFAGEALGTLARKATALVSPFLSSPVALLALLVGLSLLGAFVWLLRRIAQQIRAGRGAYAWLVAPGDSSGGTATPGTVLNRESVRATVTALGVLVVLEVLVNDSGLAMFWFSAAVAGPALLAVFVGVRAEVGRGAER